MEILGKLLLSKWLREGELYADAFSLGLTGNKEAAVSSLEKRKSCFKNSFDNSRLFDWVHKLFNDHPSEEIRINEIQKQRVR